MTLEALRASTRKTLAVMARRHGVDGWHSMTKAQLIEALAAIPRLKRRTAALQTETSGDLAVSAKETARHRKRHANVSATANGRGAAVPAKLLKSLVAEESAAVVGAMRQTKERFVVLVRDAFWLQANWEFRRETICRAQAALGYEWHQARPVIRVLDVTGDETANAAEGLLQEIEIHGGVNHWYIALDGRPRSYRLQIGYRTPSGKFFALARSNVVTPPRPGAPGTFDGHWNEVAQQYERVFSLSNGYADPEIASPVRELFEERLRKPMGTPISHPPAAEKSATGDDLPLSLSAELILYGATHPRARLTMEGEPVALRADGSFVLRMSLPEGRQMLPAVAVSADGMAQRTVIVTIERNTKELEPLALDEV